MWLEIEGRMWLTYRRANPLMRPVSRRQLLPWIVSFWGFRKPARLSHISRFSHQYMSTHAGVMQCLRRYLSYGIPSCTLFDSLFSTTGMQNMVRPFKTAPDALSELALSEVFLSRCGRPTVLSLGRSSRATAYLEKQPSES